MTTVNAVNTYIVPTAAREIIKPLQPAFSARIAAVDNNVTGDGTAYVIGTNVAWTEEVDQNSDFNTNGTFTAPITGVYHLGGSCMFTGITANHTNGYFEITTTARNYYGCSFSPIACVRSDGRVSFNVNIVTYMTAGQTAQLRLTILAVDKTIDLITGANGFTTFYGFLTC